MNLLQSLFGERQTSDLKSIIEQGAFLVDVRSNSEFAGGHLKGSVNVPLENIAHQLAKFKNRRNIIVFCRSGSRSNRAKTILEHHGFTNVVNGGSIDYVNKFIK